MEHIFDINTANIPGKTVLHCAFEGKNPGAIKALLSGGAFVSSKIIQGCSVMQTACVLDYNDVLCMMLDRQPDLIWMDNILEFAARHATDDIICVLVHIPPFTAELPNVYEDASIVRHLLNYESSVDDIKATQLELDAAQSTRRTPLHLALFLPEPNVALELLEGHQRCAYECTRLKRMQCQRAHADALRGVLPETRDGQCVTGKRGIV